MIKEKYIDILSIEALDLFDAVCFTSNGIVKNNEELVMGAGVALRFRNRFKTLALQSGRAVKKNGNICQVVKIIPDFQTLIIAFPTKYHFKDPSDINLIKASASQLMRIADKENLELIGLPKPGCMNGGLEWETVKEALEPIVDERIIFCHVEWNKRLRK